MTAAISLERVPEQRKAALYALVDAYLHELAAHRERPVGPTCAADYEYLPLYWSEPGRHPFYIEHAEETVGFVLVRQIEERGQLVSQMSDFNICAAWRRRGFGGAALAQLWHEIPGQWELQVHVQNHAAMKFWPTLIARHAAAPALRTEVVEDDGRRIEYRFRIAAQG